MKFILISSVRGSSGSIVRYANIANALARRGHRVVYIERPAPHALGAFSPGVRCFRSPVLSNFILDIIAATLYNTVRVLRHRDTDIVIALKPSPNTVIPACAARFLGMKTICDIDDLDFGYLAHGTKRRILRWWFHHTPQLFHCVSCHTPRLREYAFKHLHLPAHKLYFLAQGVSSVFLDSPLVPMPQRTPQSIMYCATLGITSDFGDLLPMFNILRTNHPHVRISVVGEGNRKEQFLKEVQRMGLQDNIHFRGFIPHEKMAALVGTHRIGINYMRPSLTNDCRAILKIREYLAQGLAVVCNNSGDANTFHEQVYVERSIESMGNRLGELLSDSSLSENRAGRELMENKYRWDRIVAGFEQRLNEIPHAHRN